PRPTRASPPPTWPPCSRAMRSPPASPVSSVTGTSRSWPARQPEMTPHTDVKFHRQLTQIGCDWGNGGHTELYLLEGDRLALIDLGRGLQLRVVHTPGHTLGCCTFVWEREGIAISGDSVLGRGSRVGGMPLIFYPDQYRRTIERVRALRPRALCLGHHYRTLRQTNESIRFGDLVDAFLDESREIADLIANATERAVAAEGREAPFEPVLRRPLA